MPQSYFLSIIIPAYNAGETIERCIKSCIQKTTYPYEIVIVNDGSGDNTEEIIKRFADNYENICLINQENRGVAAARNTGLRSSQADLIMFVDADDELLDGALQTVYEDYQHHKPDLLSYYFNNDRINGVTDLHFLSENFYSSHVDKQWLIKKIFFNGEKIALSGPCCRLYCKEIIEKNHIEFNESLRLGEDRVFNNDYICHIDSFEYIDKCIYTRHVVPDSITHKFSVDGLNNHLVYFNEIKIQSEELRNVGIDNDNECRLRIVLDSYAALKSSVYLNNKLEKSDKIKTAKKFISEEVISDAVKGLRYRYGFKTNVKIFLLKRKWVRIIPLFFRS